MGTRPFQVLWKVVFPTLVPTMFSLTVMTFITDLCAMSAPTLLGYDSINPEIVRLAGSSTADEAFPQARAALLSVILAIFTIVLMIVIFSFQTYGARKGSISGLFANEATLSGIRISFILSAVATALACVIVVVSGVILYLVYGVGSRDLGERLEIKEKRRKRLAALKARFSKKPNEEAS